MKQFNLEKALAGHPLVTRDGRTVTDFRTNPGSRAWPYLAKISGREGYNSFGERGQHNAHGESLWDLFLADEAEQPNSDVPAGCKAFDLKQALAGAALVTRDGVAVHDFRLKMSADPSDHFPYIATVRGNTEDHFTREGRYRADGNASMSDLFLVDETLAVTEIPAGCKPFNLEAALAGAPLMTRGGEHVSGFRATVANESVRALPYRAYVGNYTYFFKADGAFSLSGDVHERDLFLVDTDSATPAPPRPTNPLPAFTIPTLLQQADKLIYGERQENYGSVTENFTNIAKGWNVILGKEVTPEQVGLCMAWLKIARQVNRPAYDNILDLAGYAGCIDKLSRGE